MQYTIRKLADMSGVSVRTLHWYDKIDLLKPAYVASNGYRYYEEEQLLLLQQILFFRELGFKLSDVQKLLSDPSFDKGAALRTHKRTLEMKVDRLWQMLKTIDKTLQHLGGNKLMNQEELYYGFGKKLPKSTDYVVVSRGTPAERMLEHFKKDEVIWTEQQWASFKDEVDLLDKDLANLITQGAKPDSEEVQKLMQKHYDGQSNFFNLNKDAYLALMQLYADDQGTIKMFFDAYHPQMQQYIVKAMRFYADKNL